MKVDNKQIAQAVFFKLYYSGNKIAAARLAAGIFNERPITLNLGDIDHAIESELDKFGCNFIYSGSGNTATFNMNGQTEIDSKKWEIMCDEIYN